MINIFRPDNTNYSNNGNATLVPIYCTQKVNINGVWQVVMEHPYDKEERWKFIVAGAVLKIHTTAVETTTNDQLYRIYSVETGLHSVYCEALPIALDAYNDTNVNSLVIDDKTGTQFASTLNDLWDKYTITSNISAKNSGKYQNTNLIEILNGGDKCFSKLWKGEIKYDNTAISVNTRLDSNPATYKLRLGRDIKDIKYKVDETDVITRIYPVGASGARLNYQDDYHIGDGKQYIDSSHINDYPIIHKAYIKTDYLICTTKADSKDGEAYFNTAQLLGNLSSDIVSWYSEALDEYMAGTFGYKGNIDFIKKAIKYTKKKDGVKGLAELLKDSITYLKNEELLKYINQTIDGSVGFVDNYDDSKYSLTKVGDRKTTITDGLQVNKGKDNECLNFEIDTTKISSVTQIVGLIYDNSGKIVERKEWSGTNSYPTFQIKVGLDGYDAIRIYYEKVFGVGTVTFPLIGEAVVSTLTTDYADWSDGIRIKKNEANSQVWFELDVTKIDEVTKIVGTKHNKSGAIVTTNIFTGHESSVEFHVDVDLTTYESLTIYYSVKLPSGTSTMPVITEVDVGNIPYDYYRYLLQNPQFESESEWVTDEWQRVDNRWRRFDENGYMLTVSDTGEWGWWNKSSHRYYGNAKKSIYVFDQWLKINGDWIWFDSNGDAHQRKSIISTLSAMFNGMFSMNLQTLLTDGEESLYKAFYLRLTTYAQDMYSKGADLPTITVDVDAMVLNNVVGYEGFATLKLGNGVHVDFGDLEADERVIGIEYDCVTNRNSKIILGAPSDTITSMINRKADVGSGYVGGYGIKIENNLITYSGGEGEGVGGSGSGTADISVLPKATEGTPVADIIVDDHTYHLYGGLQWWKEERILHNDGMFTFSDYQIKHVIDYGTSTPTGWVCTGDASFDHTPNDGPISPLNWDAKAFYGAGTEDDSYNSFLAQSHCLMACYARPYTDDHISFCVMFICQTLEEAQGAVARSHNGFMHRDFDTGFLRVEQPIEVPLVDGGQYWYAWHQGCIFSLEQMHYKTTFPFLGMFPPTVTDQQIGQMIVDRARPANRGNKVVTVLENSDWESHLMYGGEVTSSSETEEGYQIKDMPFRVTNGGTIYCKGLIINGTSFYSLLSDTTINGHSIVDREYKTAKIKLGDGLSYDIENNVISADVIHYTAGDNIDITNNVISATDTTYDVFGEKDGLVPAPYEGDTDKFLKGDGTWAEVKINNARTIAWKNITPTQYEALSSAEKNNGVIYLVSENAQGASGFFTAWKSVTTAPSTADNILYLESENANGAMSMEITPTDKIPTENDNNLYFVGG